MLILIGIFAVVLSGALPGVLLFVLLFVGIIVAGLLIAIGIERLIVFAIASRRARKGVPTQEAIQWPSSCPVAGGPARFNPSVARTPPSGGSGIGRALRAGRR